MYMTVEACRECISAAFVRNLITTSFNRYYHFPIFELVNYVCNVLNLVQFECLFRRNEEHFELNQFVN